MPCRSLALHDDVINTTALPLFLVFARNFQDVIVARAVLPFI